MKVMHWSALACASGLLIVGALQGRHVERQAAPSRTATLAASIASPEVTLTLATSPVSTQIHQGDTFGVTMAGTWSNTGSSAVYLQASDSAGTFIAPAPALAPKLSSYKLALSLPKSTPAGDYTGTFTVRACADSLCTQVHAGTTHSIGYAVTVTPVGEWETLQRNARHDGYVPVQIDPARYRVAWTFTRPTEGPLSGVVTQGDKIYFTEPGNSPSLRALRASDGVQQWRRVFTGAYFNPVAVNPPSVSDGVVYVTTTGHSDTWLYALRASDGVQAYQSAFSTQWARILNPTVHNGKVYVNAGYYGGVVYAFDVAGGAASWNASAGTYGMNTPAVDDAFVYAYNGGTLSVLDATNGSLSSSIGPNPGGIQTDYHGTPMLGSADHVLTYSGTSYLPGANRQLLDFSVAEGAVRWMSLALYTGEPAVAKGVVYATSNETHSFDAIDEATGRVLWSWKPVESNAQFIGNVVVTDDVAFVSTTTKVYAISLRHQRPVWSAPTPGTMSLGANRMLFVSSPSTTYPYPSSYARITAYKLQ